MELSCIKFKTKSMISISAYAHSFATPSVVINIDYSGVFRSFLGTSLMTRYLLSWLVSEKISFLFLFTAPVVENYLFYHLTHNVANNASWTLYG